MEGRVGPGVNGRIVGHGRRIRRENGLASD